MKSKDYTIQDEKRKLERFLSSRNIGLNNNYFRAERGPKPILFRLGVLFYQLRVYMFKHYFLTFTSDYLILLFKDKEGQFNDENMVKINHYKLNDFSFTEKYGYYCISFTYEDKNYYFYLSNRLSGQFLDYFFNFNSKNYSYTNLASLERRNFMGLLKNDG